eukprot:m.486952 g.486952  ORF g.486952 m.486952 type:complete len:303 (+) comp24695_c0_seq1:164-1072(+)
MDGVVEAIKSFVSGSIAGIACKVVEFPFDTVKVLQQTQHGHTDSVPTVIMRIVRNEGFLGLYKGMTTPIIGSMGENAVLFTSYDSSRRVLQQLFPVAPTDTVGRHVHIAASGAVAGIAASVLLTPVELVKCRLQVQHDTSEGIVRYKGPLDCIVRTVREEGVAGGLFRGLSATLLREMPGNLAWFSTYEGLRAWMAPPDQKGRDLPAYKTVMAGAASGFMYWSAFYPADTVKSRVQTDPSLEGRSFVSIFKLLYREGGVRALYKGWLVTVTRAVPSNGVLFLTYELMRELLGETNTDPPPTC